MTLDRRTVRRPAAPPPRTGHFHDPAPAPAARQQECNDDDRAAQAAGQQGQAFPRGGGQEKQPRPADKNIIKFHGIYQQDDRDTRAANKALGLDKDWMFMLRIKVPGGALTADQYLAMDQLADEITHNASLRVTTRQNFQLHGVLKGDLRKTIQHVNRVLLDSLCGCGDVERNIMAPPAPIQTPAYQTVRKLARELSDAMAPKTNAYHEVWLNGEKVDTSQQENEDDPLYKDVYLPRKFKTGIALPTDNSIDAHSQDVGLIGLPDEDGNITGYNVLVGGGFGMTHKKPKTYARLASELGFIKPEHAIETVRVVATMHRDYGDRTDRTHARVKYIVEEYGIEAFRDEFNRRASFNLQPWQPLPELTHNDWLGKHEQGDGKYIYGVYIPCGRIINGDTVRLKTAIRKIVEAIRPNVTLTPTQNILFGDLTEDDLKKIERTLKALNVPTVDNMTATRRYAMACPAQPTCGLALTEAERVFDDVISDFEQEMRRLELDDEPITIRMTGCPNGCARPYSADIGLVGHKPGHYDIFIGGSLHGHRMAEFFQINVPQDQLVPTLRPLLEQWRDQRMPEESLGDFWVRTYGINRDKPHIVTGDRDDPAIVRLNVAGAPA
ncbi:MAG: NADPH-dependent assimilatory sulfite reductase hemoprotein subunit [Phycisphaeraceae bacterium]